ncbi:Katanin p60 ATPase-containing subunit A-like 2 [Melipona quadrifasciata]|uniref:Katanin p60 ATPase-containing subunit A-like 2 n=1 Tax=Melipona quadrifasciata TaxID=166423 RepID=A0A0N0U6D6_9HYME|nr:Katanin p60 ATPase-containing subunit A-like 2 [Melipona quadrifasciata]
MKRLMLDQEENRILERNRNILYLIYDYLDQNGFIFKTNVALLREARLTQEYRVCDNIDLKIIITEYENYYKMKFQKYPMLCAKITKETSNARKVTSKAKVPLLPTICKRDSVKEKNEQEKNDDGTNNINLAMTVTSIFPNQNYGAPPEEPFDYPKERTNIQSKISNCIEKLYPGNSELQKIAEDISHEIILNKLNVHWDDIVGLEECKTAVKEAVVYPLKYPIFFNGPFSPWKGVLLYGPPGTGKTMLAKAVATECHCTFFNITASSLVSKWRGDSEKYIRVLFDLAYNHSPTVIFIDEIDWIAINDENYTLSVTLEILYFLYRVIKIIIEIRIDNSYFNIIFYVIRDIDAALLRRLEKRIHVSLPDETARLKMFKLYLNNNLLEDVDIINDIIKHSEKYSCADIKLLCKQAWMLEITPIWKKLEKEEMSIGNLKYELRNYEILANLMKETLPTVTNVNKYNLWNKKK